MYVHTHTYTQTNGCPDQCINTTMLTQGHPGGQSQDLKLWECLLGRLTCDLYCRDKAYKWKLQLLSRLQWNNLDQAVVATVVSELTDTVSLLNFLLQGTTRRKNKMVTLPKAQVEASLITNCQISEVFFRFWGWFFAQTWLGSCCVHGSVLLGTTPAQLSTHSRC